MATMLKSLLLVIFVLLFSSFFFINEARPLSMAEQHNSIESSVEKLYLEAIKTGGPSHGGEGHRSTNDLTLEDIKKSGPSPGDGH